MEIKKIKLESQEEKSTTPPIVDSLPTKKKPIFPLVLIFVAVIGLGLVGGSFLTRLIGGRGSSLKNTDSISAEGVKKGDVYGSDNESAFPDSANGVLEKGGIDGEGTHKLLRTGGPDQTA